MPLPLTNVTQDAPAQRTVQNRSYNLGNVCIGITVAIVIIGCLGLIVAGAIQGSLHPSSGGRWGFIH